MKQPLASKDTRINRRVCSAASSFYVRDSGTPGTAYINALCRLLFFFVFDIAIAAFRSGYHNFRKVSFFHEIKNSAWSNRPSKRYEIYLMYLNDYWYVYQ